MRLWFALCMSIVMTGYSVSTEVVEVRVTAQAPDPALPWRNQRPVTRHGYAFPLGEGMFLTTEGLVRNGAHTEILRPVSAERISARVLVSDAQRGLALLATGEPPHRGDVSSSLLATTWPTGVVTTVQLDSARDVRRGEARLLRASVEGLPDAPHRILTFSLVSDLAVDRRGTPVLSDGRLVGLVTQYDRTRREGYIVPFPVIKRFLDDWTTPPYRGPASAGFFWRQLVDPVRRRHLGVPADAGGVVVLGTRLPEGMSPVLRQDDVILSWDGQPLDATGYFVDPVFGRLAFAALIQRRSPGESVPVSVWRDEARVDLAVPLFNANDDLLLVPENTEGARAPYLITGGLILRELDGRYLRGQGKNWEQSTDSRLVHLYLTGHRQSRPPGERVVFLAGVLADLVNTGYQGLRSEIVTHVNGQPIQSLADVFEALDRDGAITRLGLLGMDVDLVLDPQSLPEAEQRILQRYRIPSLSYRGETP